MALISCPDCGKDVSDQAPTCVNCGRPMSGKLPQLELSGSSDVVKKGRQRSRFIAEIGEAIIVISILVAVVLIVAGKFAFAGSVFVIGIIIGAIVSYS